MLIHDLRQVGNKLLIYRKNRGLTQSELAEKAGLSDRTYADIERGTVNMRLLTLVKICDALKIRPNDLLLSEESLTEVDQEATIERLKHCPPTSREAVTRMLKIMLDEIGR